MECRSGRIGRVEILNRERVNSAGSSPNWLLDANEEAAATAHPQFAPSLALDDAALAPSLTLPLYTMFEARLLQGSLLKKILDGMKDLVTQANFDCSRCESPDHRAVAVAVVACGSAGACVADSGVLLVCAAPVSRCRRWTTATSLWWRCSCGRTASSTTAAVRVASRASLRHSRGCGACMLCHVWSASDDGT